MEIEAELVHRSYEGPYDPARAGAFRREAHGSNNVRDRQQPCTDAVPA
jgi:hypothetical protein